MSVVAWRCVLGMTQRLLDVLNLMFADWANRGLNMWTVTQDTKSITSGTATYSFDATMSISWKLF